MNKLDLVRKEEIKRVTDYITKEDIYSWTDGQIVTVNAPTGSGKSYWVKNVLSQVAIEQGKKILVLTNRDGLKREWNIDTEHLEDLIEVINYQAIESAMINLGVFSFDEYDYIVCDEYHYFFNDAIFNNFTDLSLECILQADNKTRIFMSATADKCYGYLTEKREINSIHYDIPSTEITSNISDLFFYNHREEVESMLDYAIKNTPNNKIIYFCQSAEEAYRIYRLFKNDSLFYCAKSHKLHKNANVKEIGDMLENKKFDKQILITTTALSTGISLIDRNITDIICDVNDIDTLIQCVGRKRSIDVNDKIDVHIRNRSNQSLGGSITRIDKAISGAEYFLEKGASALADRDYRKIDTSCLLYDVSIKGKNHRTQVEKRLNKIKFAKYQWDKETYLDILEYEGGNGYMDFIAETLNVDDYTDMEYERKQDKIEKYLDSIVGQVILTTKEKLEIIEVFDIKQNGKLLKSLAILNGSLVENKSNYYIRQFETSRIIDGKKKKFKTAWKVMRLVEK